MPGMFAQYFAAGKPGAGQVQETSPCPDCSNPVPVNAQFCPQCGHQQVVIQQCAKCGKNLTASAKFCSRCGRPVEEKQKPRSCTKCSAENLPDSIYCNECGEEL
jgi:predicted amidophosphoribosyltransferase